MSAMFSLVAVAWCMADGDIDLGAVDQKEPPPAKSRTIPKDDKYVKKVGLHAGVVGTVPKGTKSYVYVLVNPLSNADLKDAWWVQEKVDRTGDRYSGLIQCGEQDAGVEEYFAVVVVVSEEKFEVGERLTGLPKGKSYSKLTIVKRTKE